MKGNKFILGLMLSLGFTLGTSIFGPYYSEAATTKPKRIQIYNSSTETFIQRKGGVNEALLNSELARFLKKEFTEKEDTKDFFEWVEYIEQDKKFIPYEGLGTAIFRTQMLDALNSVCMEDVRNGVQKEKYENLKKLLEKIDSVCKNVENKLEKVAKIYNLLSKTLPERMATNGLQSITDVLSKKGGDCNDLAPTYKAVFDHYGINCKMMYGTVTGGHVWVRVNLESYIFDLDPTWYSKFTPLEPRL